MSGASHYAYRLSSNNGSSFGSWSSWITSTSYTPTLSTNATYKLQVKCKDLAGNQSSTTTSNSYTLDTVAPVPPTFSSQALNLVVTLHHLGVGTQLVVQSVISIDTKPVYMENVEWVVFKSNHNDYCWKWSAST